jgi:hypothetical protein
LKLPKTSDVLLALWNRHNWIKHRIENRQTQITPELKRRLYMATVECQICKTLLYGLKDEELEQRILDLEEKLKDGVLIKRSKQETKKIGR